MALTLSLVGSIDGYVVERMRPHELQKGSGYTPQLDKGINLSLNAPDQARENHTRHGCKRISNPREFEKVAQWLFSLFKLQILDNTNGMKTLL